MEREEEAEAAEACCNRDMVHSIEQNGTSMTAYRSAHRSYNKASGCFG